MTGAVGMHGDRVLLAWLAAGAAGFLVLPWYALPGSVLSLSWVPAFTAEQNAPALVQAFQFGRMWLLAIAGFLATAAIVTVAARGHAWRGTVLLASGAAGLAVFFAQGFAIAQPGMGAGAALVASAFCYVIAQGLAERGYFKGDAFVAACVIGIALLVALFTLYPVARILLEAFVRGDRTYSVNEFLARASASKVWSLGCVAGASRCGVAWNTLLLALCCALGCTLLGLAFALIVTRTAFRFKRALRVLSVLPIITPPFVIGLGLILLFGRSGLVNHFLEWAFGIEPTRWIYGMQGIFVAQVFAFTPIAFLVLIGVVEGVSPSLEEAAQTLHASRWRTFVDISLPLMRPGLANAFLISFIESIADFGNPILLGGNFGVLSTEIFFSVVGAQLDPGRAATLGILLLAFALVAFLAQRAVLRGKAFTAMAGKGDAGLPIELPRGVRTACYTVAVPWVLMTLAIYAMALVGGFVENWGRDYTLTLRHYVKAFGVEWGPSGILWAGAAWSSFWTTLELSAIAAPITALLGLLTAYLLTRQRFAGQGLFEFATMLSFAVPGTVIGVSYILAFNVPPIEITGTALILIACNVFRNMPVGVRAGMASMAQIDKSLDEASSTLGARGATTLRRVLLPLLKPAVIAALVYSFVRAMTTVSAVIFLVSAQYEWATTYIINRVVNGDYGVAIAYCSVLIVLMLLVIVVIQRLVGERRLGRRAASANIGALAVTAA